MVGLVGQGEGWPPGMLLGSGLQQAGAPLVGVQHGRRLRDRTGHQPFPSARQVLPWAGLAPWRGRGVGALRLAFLCRRRVLARLRPCPLAGGRGL